MKNIFTYMMMALVAMGAFTSCEKDDSYIADTLRNRDWQGYIGTYYQNRWRLSGTEYATVMRFESKDAFYTSGRGYEVDYDTRSPYNDYAYCTFKWFIVDGDITLIYDDSMWNPIYIIDYHLGGNRFSGYIYDGTNRQIQFDLYNNGTFDGWGHYSRSGGYGDFSDPVFFNSRQAPAFDDEGVADAQPLVINRTDAVRQETGITDAVSIASGKFAEAMKQ